ncbi:MAG: M90 family metallopeptidase [Kofleriaceae bacterium]
MFGWLTERRRARLLDQPFPPAWTEILEANVEIWQRLDEPARERLRDLIVVFVAEKSWEGCGGLELTDEIRVTIAAQACLLLLGREHALYADVESILVYPSTMVAPEQARGVFEGGARVIDDAGTAILGQAHRGGPVLLAWDDVLAGGQGHGRGNVVIHELAHKIDMVDGEIDGTPPLPDRAARHRWAEVCSREFLELRERARAGKKSFLDDYGATNEAEFFAVASEAYWCQPEKLRRHEPDLHAVLAAFYRFAPPEA